MTLKRRSHKTCTRSASMVFVLTILAVGCAPTIHKHPDYEANLQAVQEAIQKANAATARAEQAAARSETAAVRAERAALKAEAIFKKGLRK